MVGAGFNFFPAFAGIGRAPDIAAHAIDQHIAIIEAEAAPEGAVIAGFNGFPIAAAVNRFIDRAELSRNVDIAFFVGE